MDAEQRRQAEMLVRVEERLRDMPTAKEFGELRGRVSQLPTIWQLAGLIFAIFGAAFVLSGNACPRRGAVARHADRQRIRRTQGPCLPAVPNSQQNCCLRHDPNVQFASMYQLAIRKRHNTERGNSHLRCELLRSDFGNVTL
jgi:hypothetical protein